MYTVQSQDMTGGQELIFDVSRIRSRVFFFFFKEYF
jgi:hypothetical protein